MRNPTLTHWKSLNKRSLLKARPWFEVFKEKVELPGGKIVDDFFTVWVPDFVAIVAIDRKNRVVIERYYKHGARRIMFAVPGGSMEPGEKPLTSAKRELLEETGYAASRWFALGSFIIDANRDDARGHFFLAEGCEQVQEPDGGGDLEETRLELLPLNKAWALLKETQCVSVGAASALSLARLHLESR